jgi:DNA-binding NarL/FixJ family response regulator
LLTVQRRPGGSCGSLTAVLGRFDPLVLAGLIAVLREADLVQILASELEPDQLAKLVELHSPTVAIIAASLIGTSQLDRLIAGESPTALVIVASALPSSQGLVLLSCEVTCISQSASTADLIMAIRAAAADDPVLIEDDGQRLSRRELGSERLLTRHELEILRHVSKGSSYGEVARKLEIGVETVRKSTRTIRQKLSVPSRASLVGIRVPDLPARRKL